ncbi:MAG TPA: type IV secretion system DNA-binding domain-containing protein [Candidatus Saccharimonadales bacterium]
MARSSQPSPEDSHDSSGVVLLLQVPRTNEKKELAAEQMFASLHGLLTMPSHKRFKAPIRERLSFEVAVLKKRIGFYVWVPNYLKDFVEEQIYAQYPTVQISEVQDYAESHDPVHFPTTLLCEMKLSNHDALPIKTFQSFEVDPLAAITATLSKFDETEEAWIQLILRPAAPNWHRKSEKYVAGLRGKTKSVANPTAVLGALWAPPEEGKSEKVQLTEYETSRAGAAEEKSHKLAFESCVRIVYRGHAPVAHAKLRLQSIIASYKQFNTTYLNGFEQRRTLEDPAMLAHYHARDFKVGQILNIEEVATLYHLPHTNVETPYILWALSQTAEPPANLPIVTGEPDGTISPVATTNFRGHNTMFGLPRSDRGRHLYIIGQTGVGKSGLLELLTISDIFSPYGFAVIDPHGDYALNVLKRIPAERANDVIYFNPADTDFPIAFNPMEVQDPKLRTHTASELIGVLKRMFESWGPRLEYILRYSLLALLDYPDATMLDITRILTDKKFRQEVLKYVNDPVVRNFWEIEFASWNDKFAAEAVAPVLNKVGAFTANPLVRNIIGQPKSSFNIRQIMDQRKILIVNLSRGLVGEDNAALLGALLVTKIQLGAMSRADIPASERAPFYLYVDEFQNFATDSFATILSEARKYGLNLTVANQYIAQMSMEVKDAVFGNVGSIVAFRMGVDDARSMQRYFEPRFLEYDLVHMHNRHFVISMTIEGEKIPGFSAISLNLPPEGPNYVSQIIERSRAQYSVSREYVDRYVGERYLLQETKKQPVANPKPKQIAKPAEPAEVKELVEPKTVPQSIGQVIIERPAAETPAPETQAPAKKKRKRKRTRKTKSDAAPQVAEDSTTLHIER